MTMIRAAWERHGTAVRLGASDVEIEAFQGMHGVRLSEDVADYFRAVNGMNQGEADQLGIRFWPLDEVRLATEEVPTADAAAFKNYFVFADYSIWAHGYAVRLGQAGDDVVIVGGERPVAVAPSFAAFLELYLKQPDQLFPANARNQ